MIARLRISSICVLMVLLGPTLAVATAGAAPPMSGRSGPSNSSTTKPESDRGKNGDDDDEGQPSTVVPPTNPATIPSSSVATNPPASTPSTTPTPSASPTSQPPTQLANSSATPGTVAVGPDVAEPNVEAPRSAVTPTLATKPTRPTSPPTTSNGNNGSNENRKGCTGFALLLRTTIGGSGIDTTISVDATAKQKVKVVLLHERRVIMTSSVLVSSNKPGRVSRVLPNFSGADSVTARVTNATGVACQTSVNVLGS